MDDAAPTQTPRGKIKRLDDLLTYRTELTQTGRVLVHCHGCFDIVHPGHIRHLRFAKAQGDALLVSITGDAQMRKGDGRPLIPQELRAENLAALDFVDAVHIDDGETAERVLDAVKPDVYIKGQEYERNSDPRFKAERETVERHGGRVVFSSGDVVFSSTALIAAMERSTDATQRRLAELSEREELSPAKLNATIESFRGRRVVIVGEVIRDTYVFCDRPEVSGESPMMSLRPVDHKAFDGGAAVIARHAAALGAKPILVTAFPKSEQADMMQRRLAADGVEVRWVHSATPVAEKQRFLVGTNKVMKLDLVQPMALDAASRDELTVMAISAAKEAGGVDAAILADFGLGLMTPAWVAKLCQELRPWAGILAGDVSGGRAALREMRDVDLLCPSEHEMRDAYRNYGDSLAALTWQLLQETRTRAAMVTLGAEGVVGFTRLPNAEGEGWNSKLRGEHVPALTPMAIDPLGCGDSMLAAATLTLATGASVLEAGYIGSAAASIQARTLGNVPIFADELRREIDRVSGAKLVYVPAERAGSAAGISGDLNSQLANHAVNQGTRYAS